MTALRLWPATRQMRFRIAAVLGATLLALILAEFGILLSGINNDYRSMSTSELIPRAEGPFELGPCGHVPFATLRYRYPTNPQGFFKPDNTFDHVLNSRGWRDAEHPEEKAPGTFRILGLGDSYLFGQGVKPDERCLDRLPDLLDRTWTDRSFETINTGQLGYNTAQEQQLLEHCGWEFAPDLVILHFVPNDVEGNIYSTKPKVEFFTEYTNSFLGTDWLSAHSEVWALARRKLLGRIRGQAYIRESSGSFLSDPEKWNVCGRALTAIQQSCEKHHARLLVVAMPFFYELDGNYPFQPIHDRLQKFCSEARIPCLDLREKLRRYNGPELWVHPTDQHPNSLAHRLAAEATAAFIVEHAMELGLKPASDG